MPVSRYIELVFNLPLNTRFTYTIPDKIPSPELGCRVMAPFGRRKLAGFVVGFPSTAPASLKQLRDMERVIDETPLFDDNFLELAVWVSEMYHCSLGEALSAMTPTGRSEREAPGLGPDEEAYRAVPEQLSDDQAEALKAVTTGPPGLYYLDGITGSGKTEVFLRVAEFVLARGQSVIYLVPEIALTHQVVDTLRARLSAPCAVLHSRLTPSQRLREWNRVRSGEARVVIGARSAVFAPLKNLGLIVLDEEHESGYKSSSAPRYHARQVAMKRCAREGAYFLMGSATPSVEAWYLMEQGRIQRLVLRGRVAGGSLPDIDLIPLKGSDKALSKQLIAEIRATHSAGKQSILFLNRRGFAYFFHCRSCGYEMKCRSCSVNLTYHKQVGRMVCHYCGYKTQPVQVCPECGSLDLGYSGFGTERVEEELAAHFPDLRVGRLDSDSVRVKGSMEATIAAFRKGELDILLGTQMVAKGLNFPGVRLVGIIMADTGLQMPDFRAAERCFALIVQVAGRAGRFVPDGRVLVQSFRPEHAAVRLAVQGKREEFYRAELETRRVLGFPPFSRLIRIVVRGKKPELVRDTAEVVATSLRQQLQEQGGGELLGPADCPLAVISGNLRVQLLIRCESFDRVQRVLRSFLLQFETPRGLYLEIDVDPSALL
jgi:primosomal protein N' (replication factor Y) (superfamily II helicase)